MKHIAVVLSGCGVYDGSEIHEAVFTLYALAKHGLKYDIFAPDKMQAHVINHLNGEVMKEQRNVLTESARIARGNIKSLTELNPDDFDAVIFPGGFGAAKNLSSYAFDGANLIVDPGVEAVVRTFADKGKVIGALCIAPVILAKVLGDVQVTIGKDKNTAENITEMGGHHVVSGHTDVVVDKARKVATGPCYMLDSTILQVAENAENVVRSMKQLLS